MHREKERGAIRRSTAFPPSKSPFSYSAPVAMEAEYEGAAAAIDASEGFSPPTEEHLEVLEAPEEEVKKATRGRPQRHAQK